MLPLYGLVLKLNLIFLAWIVDDWTGAAEGVTRGFPGRTETVSAKARGGGGGLAGEGRESALLGSMADHMYHMGWKALHVRYNWQLRQHSQFQSKVRMHYILCAKSALCVTSVPTAILTCCSVSQPNRKSSAWRSMSLLSASQIAFSVMGQC